MPELVIRGGTVVDARGARRADVVVADGRVVAVGEDLTADEVVDAGGCIVAPGLVDLHSHLRQPGQEEAETVETGSRAGALGGYTALVAMPNTTPAIDSAAMVHEVLDLGRSALCDIHVAGAITIGREGEKLAPIGEMAALGVRLFTDDGRGVQDARLMRRAMEYASDLDVILAQHCEDEAIAQGGAMHEGEWSSRLGLPGPAGGGGGADGPARPGPRPADRRPGALPAPVHRRLPRHGAGCPGGRTAGHGRGDDAPLHAHPRRLRGLRPRLQGQPAVAHGRGPGGGPGRPGRRRARRHRHGSRPPRPPPEGAALRPGAARDARASRRPWRWP